MLWPSIRARVIAAVPLIEDFRAHLTPPNDISEEKHVQLLEMTHERLIYSFTAMPFVALAIVGFYVREADATWLGLWGLGYCAHYFVSRRRLRRYFEDKECIPMQQLLSVWRVRLTRVAGMHGLALCLPIVVTAGNASFEFVTFWYLTVAAIVAGNATHQTPVLGVFSRFFNCSWNLLTLLTVIAYPNDWPYISLAVVMYTLSIYRHALSVHKFFVNQVRLEENSTRLAQQFKLAKEQAETALQEKNQFLATASHDLRQPVHAMGMLIEATLQRNRDPSLVSALQDLGSSVKTMTAMFNSLLDLSRLEAGYVQVQAKPVELRQAMRDAMSLFEAEANHRGLSLRLHLPRREALSVADENLLRQIINNLLQNAMRYTPRGGILAALRSRAGQWRMEVWDTGIGVAEDSQGRIFQPYFRHEHAWQIDSAGHGLGLSVVARSARLMGAQYGMSSRLGKGSCFWVSLPALPGKAEASPAPWASSASFAPRRQLHAINQGQCLIVEDDPQVCAAWRLLLQAWGVEVRFASYSVEALSCLDGGYKPQIILCDERLRAGESGFELLKVLQQRMPQAHGAMISGEYASPALRQAEEDGYLVLRKPVDMELMHSLFVRWLT